jgi:hypothetical protein
VHFVLGVCIEKSGGKRAYFSLFASVYKDDFVGKSVVKFRQTVILISNKRIAEIIPPDVTLNVTVFWHDFSTKENPVIIFTKHGDGAFS